MPNVRQQLFPLSERPQLLICLDLTRGADIGATQATALHLSDWLTADGRATGVTSFVGFGGQRFVLTLDPADFDPASAFMVVNVTDFAASVDVIAATFPEARVRLKRLAIGGHEPGGEVVPEGPDVDALLAAGQAVEAAFASAPGIVENQDDWGNSVLWTRIVVAQDRARQYGLTTQSVSEALEGFLDGTQVSVMRDADGQIPIVLRGAAGSGDSFADLANIAISIPQGPVSLDPLAQLTPHLDFSTLSSVDQTRRLTLTAISTDLSALDLVAHIQPTLDRLSAELGPAYDIRIGGEVEQAGEVREKLGAGLSVALVVMLTALMAQFNSFRRVGLTLLCVPLVVVGVSLALIGLDQPLSFFGTLGLIALSGIIINNAIVLIDQIDIERATSPLNAAIAEAARKRVRPILLTSLTTVLGLLPMALSGGALWEPMATLMIGGLGVSSVMTLVYVPALYRVLFRDMQKRIAFHPSAAKAA